MSHLNGNRERIQYGVRRHQTKNHNWTKKVCGEHVKDGCINYKGQFAQRFLCSESLSGDTQLELTYCCTTLLSYLFFIKSDTWDSSAGNPGLSLKKEESHLSTSVWVRSQKGLMLAPWSHLLWRVSGPSSYNLEWWCSSLNCLRMLGLRLSP